MTVNMIKRSNILKYKHLGSVTHRNEQCFRSTCEIRCQRLYSEGVMSTYRIGCQYNNHSIVASLKRYKFGHSVA